MSTEQNKALARSYIESYETQNLDTVMGFIDPDYTLHPGGINEPMDAEGRRQDESVFFSAFSDIKTVLEDQIAEGDRVVNRVMMSCTHTGKYQDIPATGKKVIIPYFDIVRIKGGKIVEEWVEFDTASILNQISLGNAQG